MYCLRWNDRFERSFYPKYLLHFLNLAFYLEDWAATASITAFALTDSTAAIATIAVIAESARITGLVISAVDSTTAIEAC